MGNCNSAICYCCGNKEGHVHGREEEENLQVSLYKVLMCSQKPISDKNGVDLIDSPMSEIERMANQNASILVLGPDHFELADNLHEALANNTKSVKDKKSTNT